ncbi:MAG: pilus assembly protein [Planctomycetes bacterium]|nr:pilus assembly protein [Planctomycetota bacterium]
MRRANHRRGATTVEGVIVLAVLLSFIVAMLDLSMALYRKHILSYVARHGTRVASVHGSEAATLGSWGPDTTGPTLASDSGAFPSEIRAQLCGLAPESVTVTVEWPDGDNEPGSRVRVTVQTPYQPTFPQLWGGGPVTLTTISTAIISH